MQNIRNEFLIISSDQELDLENAIEIEFINVGDIDVEINNVYRLSRLIFVMGGLTNYDYKLLLKNNLNEIDVTLYRIRFLANIPNRKLIVRVKYKVS
jgi:hypothetical protein